MRNAKVPVFASFSIVLLSVWLTPNSALARWAEESEAPFALTFDRSHFIVHRDGTYSVETERQVEILKESARQDRGLTRMTFDAHATRFQVLGAKTVNREKSGREKTSLVDKKLIEIKPLASAGQGFDETKQVTIAFPDVNVGSKLYSHTLRDVREPPIPGFFSLHTPLGINELMRDLTVSFLSEVELFVDVFDPEHHLAVETGKRGSSYFAEIKLKKPLFRMLIEENNAIWDAHSFPWFAVSTVKDWSGFPRVVAQEYEKQIDAALPPTFQVALEAGQAQAADVDKIDAVTSALQERLRYVGDWVPVKGAYFPRSLQAIAKSGYGDCKDFATSTAAVLRRLGFSTHVAWVQRGRNFTQSPLKAAAPDFNHAIVYVERDGQERWIDPTNTTSYARAIYSDIADRPALVLGPMGNALKRIPPMQASDGELSVVQRFQLPADKVEGGEIEVKGEIALVGRGAVPMAGASLSFSKQQIDFFLIKWITEIGGLSRWSFAKDEFKSRIASDFKSEFVYQERWRPLRTSEGLAHLVPRSPVSTILDFRRDSREAGVDLPDPGRWRREQRLVGRSAASRASLSCAGHSDWLDWSRRFERDGKDLVMVDEEIIKQSSISAGDVKTPAFAVFQDGLLGCLREAAVVFR